MAVHRAELSISQTELGTIEIDSDAEYVAIRSASTDAVPCIPWTVLKVCASSKPGLFVNSGEFGLKYLPPQTQVLWTPVEPQTLTKIVLTADPETYKQLSKESVIAELPEFVSQGRLIPGISCEVRACEPVDQGVLPLDRSKLSVSVFEAPQKMTHDEPPVVPLDPFIDEVNDLEVRVVPMSQPVALSSLLPPVAPSHSDPENIVLLKLNSLVKLGCFSGDIVQLSDERLVRVYSYPEPSNAEEDALYVTPLMCFNMGTPASIKIQKCKAPEDFELAREVTLSRVSSPVSSDKANQVASLRGLRSYFAHTDRIVRNGDLIAIPISTELAKILGVTNTEDEDGVDLNILHDQQSPDNVVWFRVAGLPSDKQYVISSAHTRMVQSGVVQCLAPPTKLNWRSSMRLPEFFEFTHDANLFKYAHYLQRLLSASLVSTAPPPTILLKSSKRGAGKATLLSSLAASLGIHEMQLNAYELIGDSDSKTLGLLKARLERAAATNNVVVSLLHLDALAKKHDMDGKDTPLVNGFIEVLDEILESYPHIIFAATVSDPDVLAASVRNKFKFEVDVTVPSEREREAVFRYLLSNNYPPPRVLEPGIALKFGIRGDVLLSSLAIQSAGLAPPDLKAIVKNARQIASRRATTSSVISDRGVVKSSPEDMEKAISEARGKFSDSIGAPKIPNVTWKDVGGLDMVKGEILDTIDMPLKHPELFANGLKKRSGILFYGPPGTGKTLLAKAIATNFSLNFFSVKGPELLNMYIGESEANVRRVFQKARDAKPCVVFFDELDSVAPKRGNKGDSGGVMDRIVSQLLAELDGMSEGSEGVFVVGATNRPDLLDEALLRPGRFDKMLYLGVSDTHEKQRNILAALTRKFELSEDVSLEYVAELCPFTYTGADFYALSSDAMLNAMTRTAGEIDAKITRYNETHEPVSLRKWFQSVATKEDTKVVVSRRDFEKAQRELVPSVSAEELQHYLRVRSSFEGN